MAARAIRNVARGGPCCQLALQLEGTTQRLLQCLSGPLSTNSKVNTPAGTPPLFPPCFHLALLSFTSPSPPPLASTPTPHPSSLQPSPFPLHCASTDLQLAAALMDALTAMALDNPSAAWAMLSDVRLAAHLGPLVGPRCRAERGPGPCWCAKAPLPLDPASIHLAERREEEEEEERGHAEVFETSPDEGALLLAAHMLVHVLAFVHLQCKSGAMLANGDLPYSKGGDRWGGELEKVVEGGSGMAQEAGRRDEMR
jgi:hypothetical protein